MHISINIIYLHIIIIIAFLQPLNTIMDLNIGTAFWFAARGVGYLREYSDSEVDGFFGFQENQVPLLRVMRHPSRPDNADALLDVASSAAASGAPKGVIP